MLELRGVSKRFGGVVATDDVTLDVVRGEVHARTGRNGAAKTALSGQLAGVLPSDMGRIVFNNADITRLSAHARVHAGLARSYQITSIFRRFSVLDNLALAVQARSGSSFSFWHPLASESPLFDEARTIAAEIGLADNLDASAATLAHCEQRALQGGRAPPPRPQPPRP